MIPSRFIVSHGVIVELSKEIGELKGVRERVRVRVRDREIWEEIEFLKH